MARLTTLPMVGAFAACSIGGAPDVVEVGATPTTAGADPVPTISTPPSASVPADRSGSNDEAAPPGDAGRASPSRSTSVGDPRYPRLGTADLDVRHYDLRASYDPAARHLAGTVIVDLDLTRATDRVALDADGPEITDVAVDGNAVAFTARDGELVAELGAVRSAGTALVVEVDFRTRVSDRTFFGDGPGLFPTEDGLWSVNEPDGLSTWLPANDHPTDKATWSFAVTVPHGSTAVLNGELASTTTSPAGTTWSWEQSEQMAPYLVLLLVGDYDLVDTPDSPSGVAVDHVALDGYADGLDRYAAVTLDQLAFFEDLFGPYPFERYGLALADSMSGLAMETQGRSLFSADDFDGTLGELQQRLLAHELAHQWFGDAVSPATWNDIWLSEGFATYAEWLWLAELGDTDVDGLADAVLPTLPSTGWPLSRPDEMFGEITYRGGAVALHAIRRTVGDDAFFEGLRAWVVRHDDGVGTTDDFQAVMESVSGRDLDAVFADWVHADRIPDRFPDRG